MFTHSDVYIIFPNVHNKIYSWLTIDGMDFWAKFTFNSNIMNDIAPFPKKYKKNILIPSSSTLLPISVLWLATVQKKNDFQPSIL